MYVKCLIQARNSHTWFAKGLRSKSKISGIECYPLSAVIIGLDVVTISIIIFTILYNYMETNVLIIRIKKK